MIIIIQKHTEQANSEHFNCTSIVLDINRIRAGDDVDDDDDDEILWYFYQNGNRCNSILPGVLLKDRGSDLHHHIDDYEIVCSA